MIRYKLRTLMIVLAIGPILLAWVVWPSIQARFRKQRAVIPAAGRVTLMPNGGLPVKAGDAVVELPDGH